MTSENADKTEPLRPIAGPMINRLHGPLHRQFCCHVRRRLLLQEPSKVPEIIGHVAQLEPQAAPELDVIVDGLSQRLHGLPPGQGSAMERSDTKSTLA